MKPNQTNRPTQDDQLFDLLADGQLDEPRRRELLSGLDDRPGGWRRCAMAFLEAQSWREAMSVLTHPQVSAKGADQSLAAEGASRKRRRPRRDHITTLLGMAASFLLAIGVTSLVRDMQWGRGPGGMGTETASMIDRGFPQASNVEPGARWVSLSGNGPDGRQHTTRLPAVQRDRLDEKWLRNLPSAVPAEVAQSLQQGGHDVTTSRRLLPFQMKDGRRLVVPVDELDVHYVSNPGYQ